MIVLASASPRRTQLLTLLGIAHEVDAAHDVDETPHPGEDPAALAERLARAKALGVAPRHPATPVLAADTVVVLEGELLGKPARMWPMSLLAPAKSPLRNRSTALFCGPDLKKGSSHVLSNATGAELVAGPASLGDSASSSSSEVADSPADEMCGATSRPGSAR